MSKLNEQRASLATLIRTSTGLTTHDYNPARLNVPSAVVMPGTPYVTDGDVFGSINANYSIELIMGTAANSVTASGLDDQIENALVGLINAGYSVENVSQPYAVDINNGTYLAATITVNANISL